MSSPLRASFVWILLSLFSLAVASDEQFRAREVVGRIRSELASGVGAIRIPEDAQAVLPYWKDFVDDPDVRIRRALATMAVEVTDADGLATLAHLAHDENESLACHAIRCLLDRFPLRAVAGAHDGLLRATLKARSAGGQCPGASVLLLGAFDGRLDELSQLPSLEAMERVSGDWEPAQSISILRDVTALRWGAGAARERLSMVLRAGTAEQVLGLLDLTALVDDPIVVEAMSACVHDRRVAYPGRQFRTPLPRIADVAAARLLSKYGLPSVKRPGGRLFTDDELLQIEARLRALLPRRMRR